MISQQCDTERLHGVAHSTTLTDMSETPTNPFERNFAPVDASSIEWVDELPARPPRRSQAGRMKQFSEFVQAANLPGKWAKYPHNYKSRTGASTAAKTGREAYGYLEWAPRGLDLYARVKP